MHHQLPELAGKRANPAHGPMEGVQHQRDTRRSRQSPAELIEVYGQIPLTAAVADLGDIRDQHLSTPLELQSEQQVRPLSRRTLN